MTISNFSFTPTDGIKNTGTFPTTPASNAAARKQIQDLLDQIQTYFNSTLTSGVNTHVAKNLTDAGGVHGLGVSSGVFTPTIVGSSTAGSNTYTTQNGFYYLVGKLCKIDIIILLSAKDAAMAGNITIGGLPFTSKSGTDHSPSFTIGYLVNFDLDPTRNMLKALMLNNVTEIRLYNTGDNTSAIQVVASQITGTTQICISGEYEIA